MNLKMWNKWKDFRLNEDLKEDGHTDVPSAIRKLKTSIEDANEITQKLQSMSDEESLPSWWSDKITLSANYLNKARDYILNPNESINENDLQRATRIYNDFESVIGKFEKDMVRITKDVEKLKGDKTDSKIFIKQYVKGINPLLALIRSWFKGEQKRSR